jgi:hypothetical protein
MGGSRATAVVLAVLLLGCAGADASVSSDAPAKVLFAADDVPSGFEVANVANPRVPSWCGGSPIELQGAVKSAAEVWTFRPGDGQGATIENIVVRFRPSAIERFLSTVQSDQTRCAGGVDITTADGVNLRGESADLDLAVGDGGTAIEAGGGTRINGAPAAGGWASRVVVRRGDSVAVVVFAVAGLEYDRGLRDRLAHLAEKQLEGMP